MRLKSTAQVRHARRVLRHIARAQARAKYLDVKPQTEDLERQLRRSIELVEMMAEEPDPAPPGITEEELDEFFDQESNRSRR